ncbi:hypothetical protein DL98DRAFT_599436 [Cadophora sp. DSE1049]|nr:hypothetical protein DL98DRAFT_599436 [Cadophora sp. DSE1049]
MSGTEAGFVIGLISGVISIIEAAKTIYDATGDAKGQPEAFRQVAARLPLVIEILHSAEKRAQALDETAQEALEPFLNLLEEKALKLKNIFEKVTRKDGDKWYERYKKGVTAATKGSKVESLMGEILKDVQVIACEILDGSADRAQVEELEKAIKEMSDLSAYSQKDEAGQHHSGVGNNNGIFGGSGHTQTNVQAARDFVQHKDRSINVHNIHHHSQPSLPDPQIQKCLQDLLTTDPRDDKRRIENTKGGLLRDSYRWILDNLEFRQWRDDERSRMLWIRGDPGKGKTMLLCGIIDEFKESTSAASASRSYLLSYFFCQATDDHLNNATAVLRGLIYLLAKQQPALLQHIREKYDDTGKALFVDNNSWFALSEIFINILHDPSLKLTYLIIDALDECTKDLQLLTTLIVNTSSISRVKWLLSSRNKPDIERWLRLEESQRQLSLELKENASQVSRAVDAYIDHYFSQMTAFGHVIPDQNQLRDILQRKSEGTFLWVALVIHELREAEVWEAWDIVSEAPAGLVDLYRRMIEQIRKQVRGKPELCRSVLSAVTTTYRPLHVSELGVLAGLPTNISSSYVTIATIVKLCGSFLTIRDRVVYTVHQSAQDFLSKDSFIFPSRIEDVHYNLFSRSLSAMSNTLRRDVYGLRVPGITIDQVKQPDPDSLITIRYSCLYWVNHLLQCQMRGTIIKDLNDGGLIYSFFCRYFLYWLEALSLLKSVSEGIIMIRKLENLQINRSIELQAFIHDAYRFAIFNRSIIEQAPLQIYCSALVFAPEKSIIRETFEGYIPSWIQRKPRVETHWSTVLQTLEGHTQYVTSVAFSPDGKQIISGSHDRTVRRWDATTGQQLLPALKGHNNVVSSVAFSLDGKQIVSGSYDKTIRRWDATTGQQLLPTLEGDAYWITSVAFSPNGKQIISGSGDTKIRRWDVAIGKQLQPAFKGHTKSITSIAFSPDSKKIVSGSEDRTVRLWDTATGELLLPAFEGHISPVTSVAYSPDGKQIVSGFRDKTIRCWDTATGELLLPAFEGHISPVTSVAFSPNGKQIVSGSEDKTVRLWDTATGELLPPAFEGHIDIVTSVAFSPDGKQIVSGSGDTTVRRWDTTTVELLLPAFEGHTSKITSVAFSPDGKQIVSGSEDKTIRLWDTATGKLLPPAFEGHINIVTSVAFSPDGKQIVSVSTIDQTLRLWDVATGALLMSEGLSEPRALITPFVFSPTCKYIAFPSKYMTLRLWDTMTRATLQLEVTLDSIKSIAFSADSKLIMTLSRDSKIQFWNSATGAGIQLREGLREWSKAFSLDGNSKHTLSVTGNWILQKEERVLWLPIKYRPTCVAAWGEIIALGHSSGELSVLKLLSLPYAGS